MADDSKPIRVEPTLVLGLDMWHDEPTPKALARYMVEALDDQLSKSAFDYVGDPLAVSYLIALAHALTPPEDRRMGFKDRPVQAANAAPHKYGNALDTLIAMGWGNARLLVTNPTAREAGEAARQELRDRTRRLATYLLEKWERDGKVFRA